MLVILQHFKAFCTSFALRMFWVFQTSYYLCSHKEFFASKTKQNIAKGTVAKSLPENQPIARNALLQRVVAFLSKVTEKSLIRRGKITFFISEWDIFCLGYNHSFESTGQETISQCLWLSVLWYYIQSDKHKVQKA